MVSFVNFVICIKVNCVKITVQPTRNTKQTSNENDKQVTKKRQTSNENEKRAKIPEEKGKYQSLRLGSVTSQGNNPWCPGPCQWAFFFYTLLSGLIVKSRRRAFRKCRSCFAPRLSGIKTTGSILWTGGDPPSRKPHRTLHPPSQFPEQQAATT